jgi:hypothetical protein
MYPHERSLVSRMEGKPFALIGVNSDNDKGTLKDAMNENQITWRSFWNGGSTNGPISRAWKVQGWPTLVVIDAKGVIRHKFTGNPGDARLDTIIDQLVAEAGK